MFPLSRRVSIANDGGGVIGPRDNVFPGPTVALDGPAFWLLLAIMLVNVK